MIGQSLSNTNEKYYSAFSKKICKLNMALGGALAAFLLAWGVFSS
jgi:hypothetical protein